MLRTDSRGVAMKQEAHKRWARHLRPIMEEVIWLLQNRYIFRTIQEIIRLNQRLQEAPGVVNRWTWTVYATSNGACVRRLAGESPEPDDVSLVLLLNEMLRQAEELWEPLDCYFPDDLRSEYEKTAVEHPENERARQAKACRRLIGADRRILIQRAKKVVHFASKRVAHRNHSQPVHTTFDDLDEAIECIKILTEKYLLLIYDRNYDLQEEMEQQRLKNGWDSIFLVQWATKEILAKPLGKIRPPRAPSRE